MLAILQACQGIPQAKSLMQNVVRRKLEGKLSQLDVPFYLSTKTILNEAMFYIVHVGKLLKAFHQVTPCHIFSMKYTLSWSIKHRWTLQFFHKHMNILHDPSMYLHLLPCVPMTNVVIVVAKLSYQSESCNRNSNCSFLLFFSLFLRYLD